MIEQAESLLVQDGDPGRIAAMAEQGIRDDEWRLQRIRPFDWYTVDYKRQAQRELAGEVLEIVEHRGSLPPPRGTGGKGC